MHDPRNSTPMGMHRNNPTPFTPMGTHMNHTNINTHTNRPNHSITRPGVDVNNTTSQNVNHRHDALLDRNKPPNKKLYETKRKRNELDSVQEEILLNDYRKSVDNNIMPKMPKDIGKKDINNNNMNDDTKRNSGTDRLQSDSSINNNNNINSDPDNNINLDNINTDNINKIDHTINNDNLSK